MESLCIAPVRKNALVLQLLVISDSTYVIAIIRGVHFLNCELCYIVQSKLLYWGLLKSASPECSAQ